MAGRVRRAVRTGSIGRKAAGPVPIGSGCGTAPLRQRFALPPLPKGEALAGRVGPAVRWGPIGSKAPGLVRMGSNSGTML